MRPMLQRLLIGSCTFWKTIRNVIVKDNIMFHLINFNYFGEDTFM